MKLWQYSLFLLLSIGVVTNANGAELVLENGWSNAPYSTRNAEVTLVSNIVHLHGAIASGTTPVVFTLPTELRPQTNIYVEVDMCSSQKGRLMIEPNGRVS